MPRVESKVEVHGRDASQEAYRISTEFGDALVPEHLMAGLRPGTRPSHQEAYEWIAAHRKALTEATRRLSQGLSPRPPYDTVTRPPVSSLHKYSKARPAPQIPASDRSS